MRRIDGHLGGEAVTSRGERLGAQALQVADVGEGRVDRGHARRRRGEQRQLPRQTIGAEVSAEAVAVRLGPDLGAQGFGPQATPMSRALEPR